MKIFLRMLSYANRLRLRLPLFFFYSVMGIIFCAFNVVLVIPMLRVLFDRSTDVVAAQQFPGFRISLSYLTDVFNYYYLLVIRDYGKLSALLFVCALIVACAILA